MATLRPLPFIKKTRPPHKEPLWKTTSGLQPPSWKTAEIDGLGVGQFLGERARKRRRFYTDRYYISYQSVETARFSTRWLPVTKEGEQKRLIIDCYTDRYYRYYHIGL